MPAVELTLCPRCQFVVVEDLVPQAQLDAWREQFWGVIDASPDDASTWPGTRWEGSVWAQNRAGPCVNALNPPTGHIPQLRSVVRQLGGAHMAEGQRPKLPERPQEPIEHAVLQWPPTVDELSRGKDWALPTSGHIDAANPPKGGWVGGVAIVAATYLFDVKPQGGGT